MSYRWGMTVERRRRIGVRQQPEKIEQSQIIKLWQHLGGKVYIIGTKRPRGKPCPKCGTFVPEFQGTCQTPGIPDLYGFLPTSRYSTTGIMEPGRTVSLWLEAKAPGGRMSDDQKEFRDHCIASGTIHVVGGVNEFIAFLIEGGWIRADQVAHYRVKQESAPK